MNYLYIIIPTWAIYLALTENFELSNLVVGLLLAIGVTVMLRPEPRQIAWGHLPQAILATLSYIAYLTLDIIRTGLQVAKLVVQPKPKVNSGIVAIPTESNSPLTQTLSAHAITITPGELVVEMDGEGIMYTHGLDVSDGEAPMIAAQEVRERMLGQIAAGGSTDE